MSIHIIIDSCCDLTSELKNQIQPDIAPLKVKVNGGTEYSDDGTVDIATLIREMADSRQGATSSCPSAEEFAQYMRSYEECFVVTLSSRLSGSYNSARVAADMVREEFPDKKIHVFDSESASAGEVQVAIQLYEKIQSGLSFEDIIPLMEDYIKKMHTYFVLEDLGNFIKNGRLSKVSGLIASVLSLCPIMGDNGQGEVRLVAKARGIRNSLRKLTEMIAEQTADKAEHSIRMVMGYCNCPERAAELKQGLLNQCAALREVILVPTGALSSMYANNGGIVIAY